MHRTPRLAALGVLALSAALLSSGTATALAATTGGGTVEGYVLTGGGAAIGGATVTARAASGGRAYTTTAATTGQFGATLPVGRYVVKVSAAGYSTATVGHPVVLTAGKVVSMNVHLRRPGTLSGSVVEKGGHPVRRARVELTGPVHITVRSTASGSYARTLPAGRYTVSVTADGFAARPSTTVRVRPGVSTSAGITTLRDEALVTGHVRSADGAPVSSVAVRVTRLGGTRAAGVPSRRATRSTANGAYRVDALPAGRYRVALVLTAAQSAAHTAPKSVALRLSSGEHGRVQFTLGVGTAPTTTATTAPVATPAAG